MALEAQLLEVPFRKGLDTKTNAKLVLAGTLLALENGIFTEAGTIKKRNGYIPLAKDILGAARIQAGEALAHYNQELLLFNSGEVYSFSAGANQWIDRGFISPITAKTTPVIRNTYSQSNPDAATNGGITVAAWVDARGGVRASVIDDATNTVILADVSLNATAVRPRVVAVQQSILVLYQNGANIIARSLSVVSPTAFGAENVLATDGTATAANQHIDVCSSAFPTGGAGGVPIGAALFAYNTGGTTVKVGYVRADGLLGQTSSGFPNVTAIAAEAGDKALTIQLQASTGAVYCMYANATQGVRVAALFSDFSVKLAASNVEAAVTTAQNVAFAFDANGNLRCFYEVNAALAYNTFVKTASVTPAGAASGVAVFARGVGLAGKPWLHTTGVHVLLVHDPSPSASVNGLQNTYFLMRADGVIAGKFQYGSADRLQGGQIATVFTRSSSLFSVVLPMRTQFVASGNTSYSLVGISQLSLTFGGANAYRSAQLGDSLLLAGGFLGCYDGYGVVENGFHLYPENVTWTPSAAGGSMASGVYQIVVIWEWIDARGQTHRSAPSVPQSITVVGPTGSIAGVIPTLRMTAKTGTRTNVQAVVYSTTANGTVLFRTGNGAGDPVTAPLYNDPTVDTIAYTRTVADASITTNQPLYAQGGILNNLAPPSGALIAATKNVALLAGLEDRRRCYVSKQFTRTEGVAFTGELYFDLDPTGGEIAQVQAMDEKFIFLKQYQLEYVAGDPPDDSGQNGTFTNPVLITSDVGCVDPDSVAITPNGIVFKSQKGIYLLDRALSCTYIGAPVEKYNGNHVVAATLVEATNQVRFLLDDGVTALMWDYFFNEWSVFTNHGGVDSSVWNATGNYVYLRPDGSVYQETPGIYQDAGVDIHLRLLTAWLRLGSLQGFQRVRKASFIGDFYSPHTLNIRIAYDYLPFYTQLKAWVPANVLAASVYGTGIYGAQSPYGGVSDPVNQWQIHLPQQRCEAVQFEILDVGSGSGQAYSLSGLLLEVALKKGSMKLPPSKSL
jgi:hypothetical protein